MSIGNYRYFGGKKMKHKTRWTAKEDRAAFAMIEPLVYRQQHLIPPFRCITLPGPEAAPPVGLDVDDSGWGR